MLTKEREQQIRNINEYTDLMMEKPLKVRDELLEEIDRLRGVLKEQLEFCQDEQINDIEPKFGAFAKLQEQRDQLQKELEILKNPSDGRCMEIGALRLHNAEILAENEKLQIPFTAEIKELMESSMEIDRSRRKEIIKLLDENQRLTERIGKLQHVLTGWLAATPTDKDGRYCERNNWHACRAYEALSEDEKHEKNNL